jgi:PAS domain S-box-containing protein
MAHAVPETLVAGGPSAGQSTPDVLSVLVVDGEAELAANICRVLTQTGYAVRTASTGAAALQSVHSVRPDLVLLARDLPDMDGREVCRQIKADAALEEIFVIMASVGGESGQTVNLGLADGADGHILRPISNHELAWRIESFVRILRLNRKLRLKNEELQNEMAERKRSEEEVRKLACVVGQSPTSIVITDLLGSIEYVNAAFCVLTGYSFDEARGRNPRILKSGKHDPNFYQAMWEVLLQGKVWRGEMENKKKNGELYWEWACISPVRDEQGQTTHYVAIKENITERKRAAQQLVELEMREQLARRALAHEQELNLIKSRFVSMVSHEFRTPLSVISGAAQLLTHYAAQMETEEKAEQLKAIDLATGRMTQMMNDLLLFGRLEAGRMECCPSRVELERVCQQISSEVHSEAGAANPIQLKIAAAAHTACVDKKILEYILGNLLSNAVKYSKDQQPVSLEVARVTSAALPAGTPEPRAAEYLEVKVTDTGIGIPAAYLAELFQTFHRAANVGNRPGTGMGLAIVKQFVELHRGSIRIQSVESQGTAVWVWLPIKSTGE